MGITAQQIHKYEQGSSQITMQRLGQLCAALEVSVSYFVDGFGVAGGQERTGRDNDPHHRL